HNGSEIYNLPSAVLRKRIVNIMGGSANDRLVPIDEETDIVSLKGFVIKPEHARKTRGDQFFFVNDRYFKSTYFNHSVTKAFDGLLKQGTYPGYFLYMQVDPQKIDVNVHPTKTEIKFEEEKFIYSILLSSIRQALGKYNIAPTLEFEQETSFDIPHAMKSQTPVEPSIKVDTEFNPFQTTSRPASSSNSTGKTKDNLTPAISSQGFGTDQASASEWENFYTIEDETPVAQENYPPIDLEDTMENVSSFLVKGSYIITPSKSGLMMIHARRAIEQIVYTDIHNSFIINPIESQKLLFPIEKELSNHEATLWSENKTILKQLGYTGELEGSNLKVDSVPSVIQEESISNSLDEIFQSLGYKDIDKGEIAHTLVLAIAKSAAMKKLNLSSNESIQGLIDQLFLCENHAYSPRNKKIIETITLDELQQKFS
ncbi:MAG: DNA mismatch repair endonuclease MutL, partial [Crocinitomicaceae bacterium]